MRCENCQERQAEVHLTQIVDNEMTTVHLCEACAAEKGVGTAMPAGNAPLTDFLAQIAQGGEEPELSGAGDDCPFCGTSASDFRKTGRLGCSQCYPHFAPQLRGLLRRVHGSTQHIGKVYVSGEVEGGDDVSTRLATLKRRLERAVEIEDFEAAARLRDEIQELEVTR